jgi:hypothetical protein
VLGENSLERDGMAAQAGAGANLRLDLLVGPAAVVIRSLSPALV